MAKKILCPFHQERTPSCVIYSDHFACYGCGKRGPRSALKGEYATMPIEDPEPEDLAEAFRYIDSLPFTEQRGLSLPTDRDGFYIVWPDRSYYKYRFFSPWGPKYIGARGHVKPLFTANTAASRVCLMVEGELNALSLAKAVPELTVVSPGGSGNFSKKQIAALLTQMANYDILTLIVDEDAAGAKAVVEALPVLRLAGKRVWTWLMTPDANQTLQDVGVEALRSRVLSVLEEKVAEGA